MACLCRLLCCCPGCPASITSGASSLLAAQGGGAAGLTNLSHPNTLIAFYMFSNPHHTVSYMSCIAAPAGCCAARQAVLPLSHPVPLHCWRPGGRRCWAVNLSPHNIPWITFQTIQINLDEILIVLCTCRPYVFAGCCAAVQAVLRLSLLVPVRCWRRKGAALQGCCCCAVAGSSQSDQPEAHSARARTGAEINIDLIKSIFYSFN
jgi:hypothetical protein